MLQRLIERWRYFWIKRKFKKALSSIDVSKVKTDYLNILTENVSKMLSQTQYKNIVVSASLGTVRNHGKKLTIRRFLKLDFSCQIGCCSYAEYRLQNSAGYWQLYVKQTDKEGNVQAEFEKDALIYLGWRN